MLLYYIDYYLLFFIELTYTVTHYNIINIIPYDGVYTNSNIEHNINTYNDISNTAYRFTKNKSKCVNAIKMYLPTTTLSVYIYMCVWYGAMQM